MAWWGSPTAVTPESAKRADRSRTWATEVSWNSSSRTAGVLGPHLGGGIGDGLGDGAGQGDLVTEVEQAVVTLVLAQLCDDIEQGLPLGHDGGRLADQGLAALDGGQGGELLGEVGQVLGGLLDGQQVLAQGVGQDQGGARVVAEVLVGQRERARSSREETICQERAWVMRVESGSTPMRSPWSRTRVPAKEL